MNLLEEIKKQSSKWMKTKDASLENFYWQDGYGAFSHSRSQVNKVVQYIHNQQEHHRKITFLEEYVKMLKDFEIDYDERYIFKLPID